MAHKTRTEAITILHNAGTQVAKDGAPIAPLALNTLHNAVHYLLTQKLPPQRGLGKYLEVK